MTTNKTHTMSLTVATHARRLSPRKSFAQRARSRAAQWRARVASGAFPCCSG